MRALRAILALEFVATLAAWAVLGVEWYVADAIATATLITFMRTYKCAGQWEPAE